MGLKCFHFWPTFCFGSKIPPFFVQEKAQFLSRFCSRIEQKKEKGERNYYGFIHSNPAFVDTQEIKERKNLRKIFGKIFHCVLRKPLIGLTVRLEEVVKTSECCENLAFELGLLSNSPIRTFLCSRGTLKST